MKIVKNTLDSFEEIKSSKTELERQLLLQKHGLIPPKLTHEEKELAGLEPVPYESRA